MTKTVQNDKDFLIAASLLGENESVSNTVRETLERMVCSLYQAKQEVDVNDARYKLFTQPSKIPSPQSLPPTKDALYLNFERANYQCQQWKKAHDRSHTLPDPTNHGWKEENGSLAIRWTTEKPAPESILEFVTCNCRKSHCINDQCSCKAVDLPCTDLCLCKECENDMELPEDDDDAEDTDSMYSMYR